MNFFNPDWAQVLDSLMYMIAGMVGIFVVIAIIMLSIVILNKISSASAEKKSAERNSDK